VSTNVSVNAHLSDIARKVLIVVANPTVSSNNGWPVGSYLIQRRTVTGFSNVEEDYSNRAAGVEIMPWRLEDTLRARGANYESGGLFKSFCVRDGRLITGQQQYSGRKVAQAVIAAVGA